MLSFGPVPRRPAPRRLTFCWPVCVRWGLIILCVFIGASVEADGVGADGLTGALVCAHTGAAITSAAVMAVPFSTYFIALSSRLKHFCDRVMHPSRFGDRPMFVESRDPRPAAYLIARPPTTSACRRRFALMQINRRGTTQDGRAHKRILPSEQLGRGLRLPPSTLIFDPNRASAAVNAIRRRSCR